MRWAHYPALQTRKMRVILVICEWELYPLAKWPQQSGLTSLQVENILLHVAKLCKWTKKVSFGPWLREIVGTLSNGNADGDGDAETCQKSETVVSVLSSLLILLFCILCLSGWLQWSNERSSQSTLILISHNDGVWNDDELLLLYYFNRFNNLDLPYDSFPFNFNDLEDDECMPEFRFHKRDLPLLAEL